MALRDWTIILVPHDEIRVHRLKFSGWLLALILLLCGTVMFGIGCLTLSSLSKQCDYLKLITLQRENRTLTLKLSSVEQKMGELGDRIGGLMEENQVFRRVAGLEALDREVTRVGIGGSLLSGYKALLEEESPLARRAYGQEEQVDELLRQADLIGQSLQESIASMEESADRWAHYPSIMPAPGYISSSFGRRSHPIYHIQQYHNGIDISCGLGSPIIAPAAGRVRMVNHQIGYGLTVELDHGYGLVTRYAHCLKSDVRLGQQIARGEVIAFVGRSGITTGPNVHYEVHRDGRPEDPERYILDNYVP